MGKRVRLALARRKGRIQARKDFAKDMSPEWVWVNPPVTPRSDEALKNYLADSLEWLNNE